MKKRTLLRFSIILALVFLSIVGGNVQALSQLTIYLPFVVNETPEQKCVLPHAGLVSWWPGDGNANDIQGMNDGTMENGATFAPGMVDQAFSFPNTSKRPPDFIGTDWVNVPDNSSWDFGNGPFSIDLWVNFTSVFSVFPHQQPLIGHTEGPGETNKWILWLQGGDLTFHINTPSETGFNPVSYDWDPITDQWYHVAITRNGSIWKLFVDGQEIAGGTETRSIPDATVDLTIGKAEDTWLDGFIDEIEIYNRSLGESEIQAIYNAGSAGKCKIGK